MPLTIDIMEKGVKKKVAVTEAKQPPEKSHKPSLMNEREVAMDFASKVQERFDRLIKATILFGSQAKNTAGSSSDIDIIIIIDDAAIAWDLELIAWYREELGKMISAATYPRELHVNTVKLTTWWQDLMNGDPVIINVLRYGEVLIDVGGFFNPLKILLQQGKIKATVEAVYTTLQRAPTHLVRSRAAKLSCIEGVYWAMIDAAQAALMTSGKLPPSPEHIPLMLKETFVDTGMCKAEYAIAIRDIYALHKRIAHGELHEIKGADIDRWIDAAQGFLTEMTRLIDIVIEKSKKE